MELLSSRSDANDHRCCSLGKSTSESIHQSQRGEKFQLLLAEVTWKESKKKERLLVGLKNGLHIMLIPLPLQDVLAAVHNCSLGSKKSNVSFSGLISDLSILNFLVQIMS